MKVAIVAANNLRYSPYVAFYRDILKECNCDYEVIYPDRDGYIDEKCICHHVMTTWKREQNNLLNYYRYRKYILNILNKGAFDFIIVVPTISGILIWDYLQKHYKHRYIFDVRDYTYEKFYIYYSIEKKLAKNSSMNIISSEKFQTFLPQAKYYICHNIGMDYLNGLEEFNKKQDGIVKIGYVGTMAYKSQCIRLLDKVAKDNRFAFELYGNEPDEPVVMNYARSLNCDRIKVFGAYNPADKESIIKNIDILFNAYGNNSMMLCCALSNKLYDAIYYKKAVITSPHTFMEEMLGDCALSVSLEPNETLDNLYQWYMKIDEKNFNRKANQLLSEVRICNQMTIDQIKIILKQAMLYGRNEFT